MLKRLMGAVQEHLGGQDEPTETSDSFEAVAPQRKRLARAPASEGRRWLPAQSDGTAAPSWAQPAPVAAAPSGTTQRLAGGRW